MRYTREELAEALEGADSKELGRAFQALVGEMLES